MSEDLPRGITRTARGGYRARAWVGAEEHSESFPPGTKLETVIQWREDTRSDARRGRLDVPPEGSFRADAARYLEAVAAMTTISERTRDIGLWVAEFGDRPRASITPVEIRTVRDRWLTVGPRMVQAWTANPVTGRKDRTWVETKRPLSASTVNHRLRALENLWTVLDGRHSPNPVRDVPEAQEAESPPRALPVALVRRILAAMPPSVASAWIGILAWTGTPPATVLRMDASMLDLDAGLMWVPGRRKGKGTRGRRVPLTADGVEAWRLFLREDGWITQTADGPATRTKTPKGNMKRAWRLACQAVEKAAHAAGETLDLSATTPYTARHAIGTLAHLMTGDVQATAQLLGVSLPTALRYAKGALDPRLQTAVERLDAAQQQAKPAAEPASKPADYPDPSGITVV